MKFQYQELHDLADATRNFEQITAHGIDDATALAGDLTGTLPNPTVAKVLSGQTPVSTSTALGGALGGTLPNPSLSTATLQTFLQLLTTGTHKIAFGKTTFGGNNTNAVSVNVPHGLGSTPAFVVGMVAPSTSYVNGWVTEVASSDATNVKLAANTDATFALGSTYGLYWMAIS